VQEDHVRLIKVFSSLIFVFHSFRRTGDLFCQAPPSTCECRAIKYFCRAFQSFEDIIQQSYPLLLPNPTQQSQVDKVAKMSMGEKWNNFKASERGQKAGSMFKKTETKVWNLMEPIGKYSNKLAGKAGMEGFWPTELAEGEVDKAARILKTFTMQGAKADDDPKAEATGGVVGGDTAIAHGPEASQAQDAKAAEKAKDDAKKTQKVIKKIPAKAIQGAAGIAIFTMFR
jgi:hypothetical protein